jgi:hypothetical protein
MAGSRLLMVRTPGVAVAAGEGVAEGVAEGDGVEVAVGVIVDVLVAVGVLVGVAEAGTAVGLAANMVAVGLLAGCSVACATAVTGSASMGISAGGGAVVVQPINRIVNSTCQPHILHLTANKHLASMRPSVQRWAPEENDARLAAAHRIPITEHRLPKMAGVDGSRTHRCSLSATSHRF